MPSLLADQSLKSIAQYLITDVCDDKVFVLCGAGISTSAGIPDFRSPNTGLYANLAKLDLPYAEAVFDIEFFRLNPQPFYTLARDIAPGKFIPTPTHAFIRLLHEKGKLHTCFTQNIDTLERKANVPGDKVVEAHGSFASSRCIGCKTPYDNEQMTNDISQARVPRCSDPYCGGLIKPDIVFFGESLPPQFINAIPALRSAALVIIMGTSLKVHPFAILPNMVPSTGCPRLLLNLDPAGNIGQRQRQQSQRSVPRSGGGGGEGDSDDSDEEEDEDEPDEPEEEEEAWVDDVVHLGDCDTSVRQLCDLLGWRADLERVWKEVGGGVSPSPEPVGVVGADDIGDITNAIGSMEMKDRPESEEKAKNSPSSSTKALAAPAAPARAPVGEDPMGLQHVKDNSVEKTMEKIVSDMQVALAISPNTKPKPNDANPQAQGGDRIFTQDPLGATTAAVERDGGGGAGAGDGGAVDLERTPIARTMVMPPRDA